MKRKIEQIKWNIRSINKKPIAIIFCIIIPITAIGFGILKMLQLVDSIEQCTNFNVESVRWAIIGAIGSWVGSIFGAIALVVSLCALWLPQKVRLSVSINTGVMISQMPGIDKIDAYIITVKNEGMKTVTINNVYLHFGGKKNGNIFVGMLNQDSALQMYTPIFPKRLEQGESFDYYLLRDKLNKALAYYEEATPRNTVIIKQSGV